MKKIKAIFFDIDGTLLDSNELIFCCYEYVIKKCHFQKKTRDEISTVFGKPLDLCYKKLYPNQNIKKLSKLHINFQKKNLRLIRLFPDVKTVLEKLKKQGFKLAAISNRTKLTTKKSLQIHKILNLFDIVVSREDVLNPKPHPEPILLAMKKIKLNSYEIIFVGDSREDIKAGKIAKVKTIGVLYGVLGKLIIKEKPNFTITKLTELFDILKKLSM